MNLQRRDINDVSWTFFCKLLFLQRPGPFPGQHDGDYIDTVQMVSIMMLLLNEKEPKAQSLMNDESVWVDHLGVEGLGLF